MPNIFESESDFHKWRVMNGVPIGHSVSNIATHDRLQEKANKEKLFEEILDLLSNEELRPLLRENRYYPQINKILDKLEGMIFEELKIIKTRLNSLIKHKQPSQVTKLFKYLLEY